MLTTFFRLAASSPTRRRAFHALLATHLAALGCTLFGMILAEDWQPLGLGNVLLIAGIIEGALLIGWRLTQIPKNPALEFILVTALEPPRFLLAEALVSVVRLGAITLSGLPFLVVLAAQGMLEWGRVATLIVMPFLWGLVTGLGLTVWAYEPLEVRRWGERVVLAGLVVYLVVGVLIAESLPRWLAVLPPRIASVILHGLLAIHETNPFGVMRQAMLDGPDATWLLVTWTSLLGVFLAGLLLYRAVLRLLPHFHDLHYRPVLLRKEMRRAPVGDRPLSWWAVKRVGNYSGRINLWLAGGFTLAYSAYLLAGPIWPAWLGRQVFVTFESMGGIAMLTTALALLAAVPAAFQYGLWDHDAHERARRLELLLLTDLDGRAYWEAAFAAAWIRGRGYFCLAAILWLVGVATGHWSPARAGSAAAAGVVLWGLYFALGFWAFSQGLHANHLGLGLTLFLPLATYMCHRFDGQAIARVMPPGSMFFVEPSPGWVLGPVIAGVAALTVGRIALLRCDGALRRWYGEQAG